MKRAIAILLLVFISLLGYSDTIPEIINKVNIGANPLDTLQFDQIVASNINFDFKTNKKTYFGDSFDDYTLTPVDASSITEVDSSQFKYILDLFSDTATYGDNYGDCFEPRFALQFKRNNKEVFRILICEDCNQLESTFLIPAAYQKFYDIGSSDNGKHITIRRYLSGFSDAGKININNLCRKLNLGYCKEIRIRHKALDSVVINDSYWTTYNLESLHFQKTDTLILNRVSEPKMIKNGLILSHNGLFKEVQIKHGHDRNAFEGGWWTHLDTLTLEPNTGSPQKFKIVSVSESKLELVLIK